MKRIVIVSPFYNGLYKYTRPLFEELKKRYSNNYEFIHVGNPHMTFDLDEIENTVDKLSTQIIDLNPDIIHYNYGTYDVEQLIPYYLEKKGFRCKTFLTYHSLQLDIFKKINHPFYDEKVNEYMGKMDGYVFFTNYAKKIFYEKYPNSSKNYVIAFHPATHLDYHLSLEKTKELDKKFNIDRTKPIATLLGYSSHWKDTRPIIKLIEKYKDVTFFIGGPWWKEKILKENEIVSLEDYKNLILINKELDNDMFIYAMDLGVGLFPYKYYKSFQGSGLLPNYLYRGINVVVSDINPLKEYAKNTVNFFNDDELYVNFENALKNPIVKKNLNFSYISHAEKIEKLYRR